MTLTGKYFYGNEISAYGQENKRLDYATLAKAFDCVINNDIMSKTYDLGYWEQESGFINNSEKIEELEEQIETLEEQITLESAQEKDDEICEQIDKIREQIEELENEQEEDPEIYQYYIVSDNGARILEEINEIVFYNEYLDMYIWGVCHYGTSWDYVLTDVPCMTETNE